MTESSTNRNTTESIISVVQIKICYYDRELYFCNGDIPEIYLNRRSTLLSSSAYDCFCKGKSSLNVLFVYVLLNYLTSAAETICFPFGGVGGGVGGMGGGWGRAGYALVNREA